MKDTTEISNYKVQNTEKCEICKTDLYLGICDHCKKLICSICIDQHIFTHLQNTEKMPFCNVCVIQIKIGDPKHNGHLVTWKTEEQVSRLTDTICNNETEWIKQGDLWICKKCDHVINTHLINSKSIYECTEYKDLQSTDTNSNDEYEQLPLKLKLANHLLIATKLIEESDNGDAQKIRWLEKIAYVLKGIENEWEIHN